MTYSSAGRYSNHVQSRHPEHKDELYSTPIYDENHDLGSDSEEHTSPQCSDSDQEDFEETTGSINTDADAETSAVAQPADECFPSAGESVEHLPFPQAQNPPSTSSFFPFENHSEYKLARFFHRNKVPKSAIADFFKDGLAQPEIVSFQSGHTLHNCLDQMVDSPPWTRGQVDFPFLAGVQFHIRDILQCIKYLASQRAYADYLSWAPVRQRDYEGSCIFSEMNTGDWWWKTQVST